MNQPDFAHSSFISMHPFHHQSGNDTNTVQPLHLLGVIYVPCSAALGEISLIYMMFQHSCSSD